MTKIFACIAAAAVALTAAPMVAAAKAPPAAVRIDIASVDFSKPDQVAAFSAQVTQAKALICKASADKKACAADVMFKINAQLNDAQRAALAGAMPAQTVASR